MSPRRKKTTTLRLFFFYVRFFYYQQRRERRGDHSKKSKLKNDASHRPNPQTRTTPTPEPLNPIIRILYQDCSRIIPGFQPRIILGFGWLWCEQRRPGPAAFLVCEVRSELLKKTLLVMMKSLLILILISDF